MARYAIHPFGRVGSLLNVYRFPRSSIADNVANSRLFESTINGISVGTIAFTGAGEGLVRVVASAAGTIALTGATTGGVLVQGAGSATFALTGEATGAVVVQGAASGSISLTGSAIVTQAGGSIAGVISGAISFTGFAAGAVITYILRSARSGRGGTTINRKITAPSPKRASTSRRVNRTSRGRR
jgi:hypothetical protein